MVRIDHLNFENKELIHNMRTIRAMYSIIAQLYIYIYWPLEIVLLLPVV
jgi:hypothetical protein